MKKNKIRTVNLSLSEDFLRDIDLVAKDEYRTRSELFRSVLRRYILRKRFDDITVKLRARANELGYKPEDVNQWVKEIRAKK